MTWDNELLERLRMEVQDYFRVFYPELRRLMSEHEDADSPTGSVAVVR